MKDHIQLGFRNRKALMKEKILSERDFPIAVLDDCGKRLNVEFAFGFHQKIFQAFLEELADYILSQYEIKLLKHILVNEYNAVKPYQLKDVLGELSEIQQDENYSKCARLKVIQDDLRRYFKEQNSANVEGLVTFRLPKYRMLLERMAEELFDRYLANREYQEFIALLRYFVSVQSGRPKLVHLFVHEHRMYTIMNEEKEDITAKCISDFVPPEEVSAENFDDLLISMLITLAPEKMIVHNSVHIQNTELFNTIHHVFDNVVYCDGCDMCDGKMGKRCHIKN